jgi:hypothetical protein
MAKPQRKNINDALAEIAAQTHELVGRDDAPRDHVGSGNAPRPIGPRIDVGRDHVPGLHVSPDFDEDGYRVRIRREKPHVSLYAHPRVFKAIRDLAQAQRKKPHDLYVEGLRLMLAQYGLDFDELDGGHRS